MAKANSGLILKQEPDSWFHLGNWIVPFALAFAVVIFVSPWAFLQIGPDEGMEFNKINLLLKHPEAAGSVWNDQPWFYSQLSAALFNLIGFRPWALRCLSALLAFAVCVRFCRFLPGNVAAVHLICAWLFFWSWPWVGVLSVSAMLELPCMLMAFLGASFLPVDQSEWKPWRFMLAGLLLAVATGAKFTASLIIPACFVSVGILSVKRPVSVMKSSLRALYCSFTGAGVYFVASLVIIWWSPAWNWSQLWKNHSLSAETPQAALRRFDIRMIFSSVATMLSFFVGIVYLVKQRALPRVSLLLTVFALALVVHIVHRPWWDYYLVHFAVPCSVIGGFGLGEMLLRAAREISGGMRRSQVNPQISGSVMTVSLIIALWLPFDFKKAREAVESIRFGPRLANNDCLALINSYAPHVHWVFAYNPMYIVGTGCCAPPELTVLPLKRFWTKDISMLKILNVVKKYDCELLVLSPDWFNGQDEWRDLVASHYTRVWSEPNSVVFVANSLAPKFPIPQRNIPVPLKL